MAEDDTAQPAADDAAIEQEAAAAEPQADAPATDEPAGEQVDEPADEPAVDPALLKINAKVRPMRHPDGEASCDLYKQDKKGNILVPAAEVPAMLEHGFELVDSDAA